MQVSLYVTVRGVLARVEQVAPTGGADICASSLADSLTGFCGDSWRVRQMWTNK